MNKFKSIFRTWLPFAVIIIAFSMLAYATVQQNYRQNANDPQIQIVEDLTARLNNGGSLEASQSEINISASLAPFVVIYDADGNPMAGTGKLDNALPILPDGVLAYAKEHGQNRLTWQPRSDTRIATVILPYDKGFVLAGRNIREVEQRESQTSYFALITAILALIATFMAIAFGEFFLKDKN